MSTWKIGVALFGFCLVALSPAKADVYHYVDQHGKRVYVDRISRVPIQFRDQLKTVTERNTVALEQEDDKEFEEMSPEEQRVYLQKEMRSLETPLTMQGNRMMLPVSVRYGARLLTLNLVLDTGASRTVIHNSAIAYLKMPRIPAGQAKVADGTVVNTHLVTFQSMLIGPYTLSPAVVSTLEHKGISSYDGLLGMDFLRQAKHEVDFDRGLIIWQPEYYLQAKEQLEALDRAAQQAPAAENN